MGSEGKGSGGGENDFQGRKTSIQKGGKKYWQRE